MIDVHVHLAAFPTRENGCFMSKRMIDSWLFRGLYRKLGLRPSRPEESNQIYLETLLRALRESRHIKKAVILGMDGVYRKDGSWDREHTEFLISNDYVLQTAQSHPDQLLAGVSINPRRRGAIPELERCAAAGAVLVKILPNVQGFDPSAESYRPFWKRMAELHLPLLSHVGYEFSLIGHDQTVGDPAQLRPALDAGVTVIAAHGASFGLMFYEKYWNTLVALVKQYPHFYWDTSGLSFPNRVGMLLRLRRHPELCQRAVFGTDYPMPCLVYPALLAGQMGNYFELRGIQNPFDRHYRLLQSLGIHFTEHVLWK
jgi:uncharacterized protein